MGAAASYALDDGGDAHPAADAERGEPVPEVPALELVDEGPDHHRAGGPERVAHRDGATVDVDLLVRHVEVPHEPHRDRRECLVDLVEIDVVGLQAGPGEGLA